MYIDIHKRLLTPRIDCVFFDNLVLRIPTLFALSSNQLISCITIAFITI